LDWEGGWNILGMGPEMNMLSLEECITQGIGRVGREKCLKL